MKAVILDSGTLINLSMNGLLYIIEGLKKNSEVRFLMTKEVKYETIDRPVGVPRFELEALRVEKMLQEKTLELPSALDVSEQELNSLTKQLMETANHFVHSNGKWIKIVSDAEMSCLALSKILAQKGIQNIIAIDERTTRMLSEKPENLEKIMSKKLHQNVKIEGNFSEFKQFKFIRSTELVYVAYKKNLLLIKGPKALEAVLFATKYKGSSVSFEEIDELKKL